MGKRPMLSSVCALVLLALASSGLAAAASRAPVGALPGAGASFSGSAAGGQRAGWTLTLKGKLTKVLPISKVKANVTWDGTKAGNINPSLLAVYKGQTLFKLIGLVDGGGTGFNVALAKKGYTIQLICSDGYTAKLRSKQIVGKTHWIIAKLKNGQPLPDGEAPYRFVGSFIKPFKGKLSAFKIVQIKLVF